ncbi:MAG: YfhO family protein, partial [Lachnospiraceae bacterium]|nr:YfhO family protein [Lachnospiraceae bacterium]
SFSLAAGAQKPQELTAAGAVKFSVPGNRQAFIYVTSYLDEIKVTEFAGEVVQGEEKEYDDLKFKRILDLGISDKDRVFVVSSEEAKDTLNLYAYMMNQEVLEDVISKLRENSVQIQSVKDTSVKAYTNGDGGRLVFSIPYDSGFRIYMDGEETECKPYLDAFVSCSVPAGEHEIEIKYMPPGFVLGSIISVFGMIAMVLVILRYRKNVLKKG